MQMRGGILFRRSGLYLVQARRRFGHWDELYSKYYINGRAIGGDEREVVGKLGLLTVPRVEEAQVRCGFKGKGVSRMLDVLLLDVYSGDKGWMEQFLQRDRKQRSLIRYGVDFGVKSASGLDEVVTYELPSPWLEKAGCEILELGSESESEAESREGPSGRPSGSPSGRPDGCHLYVSEKGFTPARWPTFSVVPRHGGRGSEAGTGTSHENEVDAETAFDVALRFSKDKSLVSTYLDSLDSTNILAISKKLQARLNDKNQIFRDLERAVLTELYRVDESPQEYEKLMKSRARVDDTIENWAREAHKELQGSIEKLLQDFASKQLSLWKVYSYSEPKLSLKLHELCNISNDLEMVQNLSHIYGSLGIQQQRLSIISPDYAKNKVPYLHREINKCVYKNFFQLQFPLIAVSVIGYVTELCSGYSMGALASLGIVLGLKRVKDTWYNLLLQFQQQIREECRVGIELNKQLLRKNWEDAYTQKESELSSKVALLEQISKELK